MDHYPRIIGVANLDEHPDLAAIRRRTEARIGAGLKPAERAALRAKADGLLARIRALLRGDPPAVGDQALMKAELARFEKLSDPGKAYVWTSAGADVRQAAEHALQGAMQALGRFGEPPKLQWFRPARDGEKPDFHHPEAINGFVVLGTDVVNLRADRTPDQVTHTTYHEARHWAVDGKYGRDEYRAEGFATRYSPRH